MFCTTLKASFVEKFNNRTNHMEIDHTEEAADSEKRGNSRQVRRHLPVATGPHTVGIMDIMCERGENGCFFRLYYPTSRTDIYTRDRQWPLWLPRKQYGWGYVHFMRRNTKFFGKLFNWLGGNVYVPALWQAVPLQSNSPYPVIIFSHGIGGNRTTYTTMCVELASQGFIVAALEHRDGSASMTLCLKNNYRSSIRVYTNESDNQHNHNHIIHQQHCHPHSDGHDHQDYFTEEWKWFEHVEKWDDYNYRNGQMYKRAEECREVLNTLTKMNAGSTIHNSLGFSFSIKHFKDQLDISRVSLIGHSFGGATCIAALASDRRFKVGVVLDGWMHPVDESLPSRVCQPALMVNMEAFQWKQNIVQMLNMQRDTNAERPMITIRGTCHQSVTDFQFLVNMFVGRVMDVRYKLEPRLCMDLTCKAILGFLYKQLGIHNKPHHDDILSGKHPLIISGTNVDLC